MAEETPTRFLSEDGCQEDPPTGGHDPALESFDAKLSLFVMTPKASQRATEWEAFCELRTPDGGANNLAEARCEDQLEAGTNWERWEESWERLSELAASPTSAPHKADLQGPIPEARESSDEDSFGSDVPPCIFDLQGIRSDSVEWASATSSKRASFVDLPYTEPQNGEVLAEGEYFTGEHDGDQELPAVEVEVQASLSGPAALSLVAESSPVAHRDSVASVTSIRFMRSGVRQELSPSSQCDQESPAALFAATPCRRVSSPTKSKFPCSGKGSLALDPASPVVTRDSVASATSLRYLRSGLWEKALESPDVSPSKVPWHMGSCNSHQSLGRRSSGASATSLRFMQSAVRSELPATPRSQHEGQEFLSMVLHVSRVSSPTRSDHGSPMKSCLRQSDMSDHRGSASFASDLWRLVSPRKGPLSPPRQRLSLDHLAVQHAFPPVQETEEVLDTTSQAISKHPRLFCLPQPPQIQNGPECSVQRQCDEDLELQQNYITVQEHLQEEKSRRVKCEEQLQDAQQERAARREEERLIVALKAEQQRLMDWREGEQQRLLEVQKELQQKQRALEREQKCFDTERTRFDMERQTVDEDRKSFLRQHMQQPDVYLLKRERELGQQLRELKALEKVLDDKERVLSEKTALETNALADLTLRTSCTDQELREKIAAFEDRKQELNVREARLAVREQQFAETADRASQTPTWVFRPPFVRRTWRRGLLGVFLAVVVLLFALWSAGRSIPQGWMCHFTDAWERYGYSLQCSPCMKLPSAVLRSDLNASGLQNFSSSIVSSTPAMSTGPQGTWSAPVAETSRYSSHFGGTTIASGICGVMFYWTSP